MMSEAKWFLRTQDETFGPETAEQLIEWAKRGRIQPGQEVSDDNLVWRKVEEVPFLDMRFSIDIGDGNPRGPFNRAAAEALLASGRLPPTATLVESREPFPEEKAEEKKEEELPKQEDLPLTEAKDEKSEEKDGVKIVEKFIEVPVEKIVEKEVIKEVPVEKIVEKVIVDETRVKELEGLLEEERRHTGELQAKIEESSKAASARELDLRTQIESSAALVAQYEAAKRESNSREAKLTEQVKALEDELRRLPQTASEVADIQVAIHSIMTKEAEEIAALLELERKEAEEFKTRQEERLDRLTERRRELLKRAGGNIEEMTRKALIERPEDPRTLRLRHDFEELSRTSEKKNSENEHRIAELTEQLQQAKAENARISEGVRNIADLRSELEDTKLQLKTREHELLSERQKNEEMRLQQETSQQALMARLKTLESPSIGTPATVSTNQSREARMVKLPSWMHLGK